MTENLTNNAEEVLPTAPVTGPTLATRSVVKVYGKRRVVNDVSIEVGPGEVVGLLGPNGAGKTTTFYMIVGMIRPNQGRIFLGNDDITSSPMYQRAKRGIGYLSQEPSIFRGLTVEQNLMAVIETMGYPRSKRAEILEQARAAHGRQGLVAGAQIGSAPASAAAPR